MPGTWIIVHFTTACLLMALANWIGLIPWRRAASAHWTERARLLSPVRTTVAWAVFLLPLLLVSIQTVFLPESCPLLIADGTAGFLGASLGCFPLARQMFPRLTFRSWGRLLIIGWGMRFGIFAVFFAALISMPHEAGWKLALIAGGYLTFQFGMVWGLVRQILRGLNS